MTPRAALISLCLLTSACANLPPAATLQTATSSDLIARIQIDGPDLRLDWNATLEEYAGLPPQARTLAEIESIVAEAYRWADWREVQTIAAPQPDDHGVLRVSVHAEPPPNLLPPPKAMAWPVAGVPPPAAAAGARPEPKLDAALSIWQQGDSRVLIDGKERRLYLKRRNGQVVSYAVAVGTARTPTPAGDYRIETVSQKPTWYPPASIRREHAARGRTLPPAVPPGPGNPLGEWFVRLQRLGDDAPVRSDAGAIGIHGTNQPRSIGRAASHGCVRMHDRDVAELVGELQRGDGITVVHSRSALVAGR